MVRTLSKKSCEQILSRLCDWSYLHDRVRSVHFNRIHGWFLSENHILNISQFYYFVYRTDKQEMESIVKRGPTINSYSITRSYQLKENINLMNVCINFKKISSSKWNPDVFTHDSSHWDIRLSSICLIRIDFVCSFGEIRLHSLLLNCIFRPMDSSVSST